MSRDLEPNPNFIWLVLIIGGAALVPPMVRYRQARFRFRSPRVLIHRNPITMHSEFSNRNAELSFIALATRLANVISM